MLSLNEPARFNFYAYERAFMHCLYFICKRKVCTRTHVKIARHFKSTLREVPHEIRGGSTFVLPSIPWKQGCSLQRKTKPLSVQVCDWRNEQL